MTAIQGASLFAHRKRDRLIRLVNLDILRDVLGCAVVDIAKVEPKSLSARRFFFETERNFTPIPHAARIEPSSPAGL
jgi:hypothetical protein